MTKYISKSKAVNEWSYFDEGTEAFLIEGPYNPDSPLPFALFYGTKDGVFPVVDQCFMDEFENIEE